MADYSRAKMEYDAIVRREEEENELRRFRALTPRERQKYLARERKEEKLKVVKDKKFNKASATHLACQILLKESILTKIELKRLFSKSDDFLRKEQATAAEEMHKLI